MHHHLEQQARQKVTRYQREASCYARLPRRSSRRRLALLLYRLADTIEPRRAAESPRGART